MRAGILVFDGVEELDFVGPWEVLSYVNKIQGNSIDLMTVSPAAPVKAYNGLTFLPDVTFGDCPPLDILIVPGGKGRLEQMSCESTLAFIRSAYPDLEYLCSVCTGSFLLAEAGLLEGRSVTTHHGAFEEMEKYPDITLVRERIVREGNIVSAGGVASGIDLGFYLVEEVFGTKVAEAVGDGMEYQLRGNG
ncbi:MAG: DJ-1/PfpI family protein [Bacillota bacterium]